MVSGLVQLAQNHFGSQLILRHLECRFASTPPWLRGPAAFEGEGKSQTFWVGGTTTVTFICLGGIRPVSIIVLRLKLAVIRGAVGR